MCENNFNHSDSGIDIEYCIQMDNDVSGRNFQDAFKILQYGSYNKTSLSIYTANGNLSDNYSIEDDLNIEETKLNRVKMLKYLIANGEYYSDWSHESSVYDMLDTWLGSDDIEDYTNALDEADIEYSRNFIEMSTSGYSQGDYANILVNTKEYEKVMGAPFKEEENQQYFDNLFWDAPMTVRVTINDEDYYSDTFDGQYSNWTDGKYFEYDKDIFIAEILKEFKDMDSMDPLVLKSELEKTLPSEIGY